jgi:starch synthase
MKTPSQDQIEKPISVLFAVWELDPFLKVGGLGELARSLPRALEKIDIDIRVILPYYKALKLLGQKRKLLGILHVCYDGKNLDVKVYRIQFHDRKIPVYLLKHKYLDSVKKETFMLFNAAVVQALEENILAFQPKIIHCNDYHTGVIPLLIKVKKLPCKVLFTIHTMLSQDRKSVQYAYKIGLKDSDVHPMLWETKDKQFNLLLEGLVNSDIINTVSPTYAKEIMEEEAGFDLDDVIKNLNKEGRFYAILNGIDYELKNPALNPDLKYHYSVYPEEQKKNIVGPTQGKLKNKILLQRRLGLARKPKLPVIGFIGRLSSKQKGIDSLHRMILRWKKLPCQFIIMGQGESAWEERFTTLAAFRPQSVVSITTYDEELSALINAGCDFILVPSIFEPCGQVQMNAMRYGAVPIVRATGGLSDTVHDGVNGFVYESASSLGLEEAIKRALMIYTENVSLYQAIRDNALKTDSSWEASARAYKDLYIRLLENKREAIGDDRVPFISG